MSRVKSTLALVGAFAVSALAHGKVDGYVFDGAYAQGYSLDYYYLKQNGGTPPTIAAWSAENLDNGFVDGTGYASADINCHKNAAPGGTAAKVAAGGKVEFQWSAWPESHFGPVLTYAAKVDGDFASVDKLKLKWVKIDEAGIDIDTQEWAATKLIKNNNTWTSTIPSDLAAGNYVLRHEIIAMHAAGTPNGAQNYPQCVNVEITGSGTANPEGTLGTELYKATDSGIQFNPYTTISEYTIPGPALFGSGGGPGPSPGSGSAPTPITNGTTPANSTKPAIPVTSDNADADDCPAQKARRHARSFRRRRAPSFHL
ncbi:glycosyl hydrolase family 61 [Colletotrichum graminicola]|uniref:lytic cellulose monooxygenase (C4-dehydrogenating) n=1 Tax=Colletotrichum graminicola (strain M1.001 / M2 / FGSC 10212) TaxID=645133 RepID=E3QJU2_COLGM|nr:glycosyl hydrolase family 61 [Colletotrichum graminicola M1.001]EFQ31130.1 glycosyl hydrolase family 61 [Colletotrichum graminicola M1.001]WDK10635.1 glycosyl hydrolase family 61 [Colletotrichum graminicola]